MKSSIIILLAACFAPLSQAAVLYIVIENWNGRSVNVEWVVDYAVSVDDEWVDRNQSNGLLIPAETRVYIPIVDDNDTAGLSSSGTRIRLRGYGIPATYDGASFVWDGEEGDEIWLHDQTIAYGSWDMHSSESTAYFIGVGSSAPRSPLSDDVKGVWMVRDDPEAIGLLTSQVFREGVDLITAGISASAGGGETNPDVGDGINAVEYEITLPDPEEIGTVIDGLVSRVEDESLPLRNITSVFTGTISGSPVIDLTVPELSIGGTEIFGETIRIDPTEYSAVITPMRGILTAMLVVTYIASVIYLIREAVADAKTVHWMTK